MDRLVDFSGEDDDEALIELEGLRVGEIELVISGDFDRDGVVEAFKENDSVTELLLVRETKSVLV